MILRTMALTALVAAPLMMMPTDTSAQQRGGERGQAQAAAQSQAPSRVPDAPKGLERAFETKTPPPALQRLFPTLTAQPEAEPEATPPPEPDPVETCDTQIVMLGGQFVLVDCNGNQVGME